MSKALILLSKDQGATAFAEGMARECRLDLRCFFDVAALEKTDLSDTEIALMEVPDVAQAERARAALGPSLDRNRVHLVAPQSQLAAPIAQLERRFGGSLVIRKGELTERDGERYGAICRAAITGEPFGLKSLITPLDEIQTLELQQSMQRGLAAAAVGGYLADLGIQSRIAATVANSVDELLMNAIFDGPVDDRGEQALLNSPRGEDRPLGGRSAVTLEIARSEAFLGITVLDLHGSLDRDRVLAYYAKGFTPVDGDAVEQDKAGAGLGLAMIHRSGGSLFFATSPGVKTEVTVFFSLSQLVKDFRQQFQFVSTWMKP